MTPAAETGRRRRYAAVLLLALAAGIAAAELCLRSATAATKSLTLSQKFVIKVLTTDERDIVAGDSHIGLQDRYAKYAFIGRGGITPWELEQAVRAYFRGKPVGRVMIESGPQLVAANRQSEWRSLARNSLVRQILPFNVFVLEPELISVVETRLMELRPKERAAAKTSAGAQKKRAKSAKTARGKKKSRPAAAKQKPAAPYSGMPPDVRLKRTIARVASQRPVPAFEDSVAWRAHVDLVRWLVGKGGTVCLIRTPVTREYEEQMAVLDEAGFSRHREAVVALADELRIPYVDYLDLRPGGLPLKYFRNQDHLDAKGHAFYWPLVEKACFGGRGAARRAR